MVLAEYIWIDGTEPSPLLRSKTKVLQKGETPPLWGFDGSSTKQASGTNSDCVLRPVFVTHDWQLEGNISSFSRITLSFNFLGIIIRKCFSIVAKITEISASSENCFFGNKTQVISNGH